MISYSTIATKPHPNLDILLKLYEAKNIKLNILGMGNVDLRYWGKNFGVKLQETLKMCMSVDPCTIMVFTDAFDVMYIGTEDALMAKYKAFNSDIVFSTELNCHPDAIQSKLYQSSQNIYQAYKYLNSGGFIGIASSIIYMLNSGSFDVSTDDQRFWTSQYLKHQKSKGFINQHLIVLDHNASIFMSCAGVLNDIKEQIIDNKLCFVNVKTKTTPEYLHFNGDKRPMKYFYKLYWCMNNI